MYRGGNLERRKVGQVFTAGYVDEEVRSELRKDGVIMEKERYVAYVGTYTHGSSIGIHLYDVDVEEGTLTERKVVPVNNSSYVVKSKNGKYLYSIADEGVAVFAIKPDGDLEYINKVDIDGMRGCYLSVDDSGKYLFVGGYHDRKDHRGAHPQGRQAGQCV